MAGSGRLVAEQGLKGPAVVAVGSSSPFLLFPHRIGVLGKHLPRRSLLVRSLPPGLAMCSRGTLHFSHDRIGDTAENTSETRNTGLQGGPLRHRGLR